MDAAADLGRELRRRGVDADDAEVHRGRVLTPLDVGRQEPDAEPVADADVSGLGQGEADRHLVGPIGTGEPPPQQLLPEEPPADLVVGRGDELDVGGIESLEAGGLTRVHDVGQPAEAVTADAGERRVLLRR